MKPRAVDADKPDLSFPDSEIARFKTANDDSGQMPFADIGRKFHDMLSRSGKSSRRRQKGLLLSLFRR